jgi:hypothetical protein
MRTAWIWAAVGLLMAGTPSLGGAAAATAAPVTTGVLARLNDADRNVRLAAITEIGRNPVTSADVLIRLGELSLTDPDGHVRTQAVNARAAVRSGFASGGSGGVQIAQVAPGLMSAAREGEMARRKIAISLLPEFGGDGAAKVLEQLLNEDEPALRAAVFQAQIALQPAAQRAQFVIGGLKSADAAVVEVAAQNLGPAPQPQYVSMLRELEPDPQAGIWASLILARWGETVERPVETTSALLASDKPWVRNAAACALTRSHDKALKVAIDSLGHPSVDVRVDLAMALFARFDAVFPVVRPGEEMALFKGAFGTADRPAAIRGLKKHGLKVIALRGNLIDLVASERSNSSNKPLADAAVVALQDLFQLAAETEAKAKVGTKASR